MSRPSRLVSGGDHVRPLASRAGGHGRSDVRVRQLTKTYRADGVAVHALNGIDCLLGLERPDSGEVRVGDADVTRLDETQLAELRRS